MRIVILGCLPACLYVADTDDGRWTRDVGACRPYAQTTTIVEDRSLVTFVVRGDTVLYTGGDGIYEYREGVASRRVAADYTRGAFGVHDGNLVYFSVASFDDALVTGIVLDHGGDPVADRYEIITDPAATDVGDLFVVPAGIYWRDRGVGRRWTRDGTTEFDLSTTAWVVTNGREFFYRTNADLVLKPADGGTPQVITQGQNDTPAAIGDTELYYERSLGTLVDVIARSRSDGSEHELLDAEAVTEAVVDSTHFYWAHGWEVLRVPLIVVSPPEAHQNVETFYSGPTDTRVKSIVTDDCNVYWSTSAGALYGRATTASSAAR